MMTKNLLITQHHHAIQGTTKKLPKMVIKWWFILPKTNIAFEKISETQKQRRMSNHQF